MRNLPLSCLCYPLANLCNIHIFRIFTREISTDDGVQGFPRTCKQIKVTSGKGLGRLGDLSLIMHTIPELGFIIQVDLNFRSTFIFPVRFERLAGVADGFCASGVWGESEYLMGLKICVSYSFTENLK